MLETKRPVVAAAAAVAVGAVVVCASGCPGPVACDAERSITVGPDACGSEPCVVDFGALTPGLASSVRVFVDGACNDFFFDATVVDDEGEVFAVADSSFGIGDDFNDAFVFVEATPKNEEPATATLRFELESSELATIDFDLVVNGASE